MATPTPRQRSSGGLSLIVLGIVLALAAAVLVLVLTNGSGGTPQNSGTLVVVAAQSLPTGTVITSAGGGQSMSVAAAFRLEHLPASDVPAGAYAFTTQDALNRTLNGQVVTEAFMAGDVLRQSDARLSAIGTGPVSSLANLNPGAFPAGDVLFALTSGGTQVGAKEGDHVDVLATECVGNASGGCQLTQTTLQDLLVYAVPSSGALILVLTHQQALILKLLVETARIDLVLRKPGDDAPANTQAVSTTWIISHFGFTPPSG
jgi:Flp pilus assembly protein CpaB